jgi:hypothetical protein
MRTLLALVALSCLLSVSAARVTPALADPLGEPARPGWPVPDFTLPDSAGRPCRLYDYLDAGKTVILEWFSPDCGACMDYYYVGEDGAPSAMQRIVDSVAGPDTVWLTVFTPDGADPAQPPAPEDYGLAELPAQWGMRTRLLFDATAEVGRAYGVEWTPTLCIVSPDGFLAYRGAPDDNGVEPQWPGINFAARAVAELRSGQPVTIVETLPFGCPIEYEQPAAGGTREDGTDESADG